jgi:ankyrin repeat protein
MEGRSNHTARKRSHTYLAVAPEVEVFMIHRRADLLGECSHGRPRQTLAVLPPFSPTQINLQSSAKHWLAGVEIMSADSLHGAARAGDLTELERILSLPDGKAPDANDRDNLGRTAMHLAAWAGHPACIARLVEAGGDVNSKATDDVTPMLFACQKVSRTPADHFPSRFVRVCVRGRARI